MTITITKNKRAEYVIWVDGIRTSNHGTWEALMSALRAITPATGCQIVPAFA